MHTVSLIRHRIRKIAVLVSSLSEIRPCTFRIFKNVLHVYASFSFFFYGSLNPSEASFFLFFLHVYTMVGLSPC